jgi:hypothetical protein
MQGYCALWRAVRIVSAAYASSETYCKLQEVGGDELLSGYAALMVAASGVAVAVFPVPPADIDRVRKWLWAIIQGILLFALDALVALCSAAKVQTGLMKVLGGYPVDKIQAFWLVLGLVWLLEVLILIAPGTQGGKPGSNRKRENGAYEGWS